ncbi:hypothetical protein SNEBB_001626 [Seison nebaliae]|nr:hypothetical protein SNEBB_001626 [Seison nebaliae]
MEIVEEASRNCPDSFADEMERTREYIDGRSNIVPPTEISLVQFLCDGLCKTAKNETFDSEYGLAGEYCLLKAYKSEPDWDYHYIYHEIRIHENLDISPFVRFQALLKDLLGKNYYQIYNDDYRLDYYSGVRMMNIELPLKNVQHDYMETTKFLPETYYNDIGVNIMEILRLVFNDKNINPLVIHMGFKGNDNLRIHPRSYVSFMEFLEQIDYKPSKDFPPPTFPIYLTTHLYSIPQLKSESLFYPFPVGAADTMYKLTGFSIRMLYEVDVELTRFAPVTELTYLVVKCVSRFLTKTLMQFNGIEGQAAKIITPYMRQYSSSFRGFCRAVQDHPNSNDLVKEPDIDMHTFSVILRVDNWFIINDDYSFLVDDISRITDMLGDERMDAVILERSEENDENQIPTTTSVNNRLRSLRI